MSFSALITGVCIGRGWEPYNPGSQLHKYAIISLYFKVRVCLQGKWYMKIKSNVYRKMQGTKRIQRWGFELSIVLLSYLGWTLLVSIQLLIRFRVLDPYRNPNQVVKWQSQLYSVTRPCENWSYLATPCVQQSIYVIFVILPRSTPHAIPFRQLLASRITSSEHRDSVSCRLQLVVFLCCFLLIDTGYDILCMVRICSVFRT